MSNHSDAEVISPFVSVGKDAPTNVRHMPHSDDIDAVLVEIGDIRLVKLHMFYDTAVRLYGALGSALADADAARAEREKAKVRA